MADEQDSNETNEEKQKELVELLKAIPADGKKLEAMGRQAIEAGRLSQDVAPGMAEMYAGISAKSMPRSHWEGEIANWTTWREHIADVLFHAGHYRNDGLVGQLCL